MHIQRHHLFPVRILALLVLAAGLAACRQNTSAPSAESTPVPAAALPSVPGAPLPTAGEPDHAAGVTWTIPRGWELGPARQMRIATYRIHAIAGDPEDAECAVYFFGSGQGGTVNANLDRWAHQFTTANGQAATPQLETRTISGLTVSTIAVSGTYAGAGGMMGQQQEASKPNFRMLGAIVQAPQGLVFFKLTGPLNTVASAEADFNSLLNSVHQQ